MPAIVRHTIHQFNNRLLEKKQRTFPPWMNALTIRLIPNLKFLNVEKEKNKSLFYFKV